MQIRSDVAKGQNETETIPTRRQNNIPLLNSTYISVTGMVPISTVLAIFLVPEHNFSPIKVVQFQVPICREKIL